MALHLLFAFAAGAAHPAVMQGGWIGEADYPAAAREAGQQGSVGVRFRVTPTGEVGDCSVATSSGSAALDSRTCEIVMQRFRYAPARGADGKPVEEWRTQRIAWKLPAETAAAQGYGAARLKAEVKVDVAKDGGIESCEVIKPSGDKKFDADACLVLTLGKKMEPKRNEKGKPVRSVMIVPVYR